MSTAANAGFLNRIKQMFTSLFAYISNGENWRKSPKIWILSYIFLRLLLQFLRKHGLTLFKKNLSRDHVYLTGAGSGLGRLMTQKLGKMGCKLSISDINLKGVEETKQICVKMGIKAENIHVMQVDVSKHSSITESAQSAKAKFGTVTILINNAGIVSGKTLLELSDVMIERTIHVNTISHLHTIREFLPDMIANKRGHIVSIASMAGMTGLPGLADYCASKFGAVAIDESLRLELKKRNNQRYIKTTCICPFFISTGMFEGAKNAFPMRILTPEEVVKRIINAIRQEESYVTIPARGNLMYIVRLLPISWVDFISKWFGVLSTMDDFQGRGDMTNRIPGIETHQVR